MEFQDLKVLIAVIENGGITSASKVICRTPSSLTTRIANLEESLNTKLFLRVKKSMVPTPKALELYEYAKKIVALTEEAKSRLIEDEPHGLLKIGAMESTILNRLTPVLSKMHDLYPKVEIAIVASNSGPLYKQLQEGSLHAVFVADINYSDNDNIEGETAFTENLVLVTSKNINKIPEELPKVVAVMDKACSYKNRLTKWLGPEGLKHRKLVYFNSNNAILCTVAAGQGFALVPEKLIENFPYRDLLKAFAVESAISRVDTQFLWRKRENQAKIKALRQAIALEYR